MGWATPGVRPLWSAVGIRGRTPHMEQDGDDQDGGVTMVIRRSGLEKKKEKNKKLKAEV